MWLSSKDCADATGNSELTADQRPDRTAISDQCQGVGLTGRSVKCARRRLLSMLSNTAHQFGSLILSVPIGSFIKVEN